MQMTSEVTENLHLDLGIDLLKARENAREASGREIILRPKPNGARNAWFPDRIDRLFLQAQQITRKAEEFLACISGSGHTFSALDQPRSQRFLKFVDLRADRRLRPSNEICRVGKAPDLNHGDECSQEIEI
jgi:hypothetical protein